jgi:hypothetical protein
MHVGPEQLFIREIEPRRRYGPSDHALLAPEKVLVMVVPLRAECDHERRLSAAAGTAASLRIVRRRRRDIPQVDHVEVADVDPEFPSWVSRTGPATAHP